MSNARIQFSLASEDVWNAYNPQLKEGEIVTVLKANKKVKLVQGKVGGSTYSESTVIWDEDLAETTMSRAEAAAVTATAQATAANDSASAAANSQATAATSATNAKASENAAANSETNAKVSATAAKNSATSAASSASTASTQAGKAADSAAAAAGSAAQAGTFATTATDKATAADKSATAAAASAVTASDKASEAATSATNAAVSATSAAGAAAEAQGLISKAEYGFLQRNTAYKVGDIAYTTQLPAGFYLECVTAGTTGNDEPTFKTGGVTLDGTAEWSVQQSASVASVEKQVEPIMSEITKLGEVIMVSPTDETLRPLYSIYKYGRIVVLNFCGAITTKNSWGVFKEIPLPYPAKGYASAVLDPQETIEVPVIVAEIGSDTSMSVVALKKFKSGNAAYEGWVRGQLVYFTDN
nr:MAG TPA: L SHAPED TAIL FIBER PROTEIN [Caudoviricetes sp.]